MPETQALLIPEAERVQPSQQDQFIQMIERVALDPSADVAKLTALVSLQERILDRNAESEFWAAFAAMQPELPSVSEHGQIIVDGQNRGNYSKEEDIQRVVLPVLNRHGFSLSFRTEYPNDREMEIVGVLAHRNGHRETDRFRCEADKSGKKNDVQAKGSTRSYGRRYTTLSLLNIITGGQDDDGRASANPKASTTQEPDGFQTWLDDMTAVADTGTVALRDAWAKSPEKFRTYLQKTAPLTVAKLKSKAKAVDA